ncbi:unnamed protein product [Clonostachys chloroleuca]|uniref:Uncharacterized protein n=1 Tax=Clonostachys chloroleuca TaxID=1926264 RepID=A0AA35M276_9HYPO|nr:unnamed protein product [Clonostachys chloroleuca]CAI6088948.1 unnamed protein product [Clonostachys chloroleuca]CAI6089110.1 unnamed protein product [Clonostachys chloroleuca]CAI6089113.1 unnamed protein product [Clonostachys chloroleuca]
MAHTRAQLVTQKGRASSAPKDQGKRSQGIQKHRSTHHTTPLQQKPTRERSNYDQPHPYPAKKILSQQRGTKRHVDALDHDFDSTPKRPRRSPRLYRVENPSDRPNTNTCVTYEPITPIEFWARQG